MAGVTAMRAAAPRVLPVRSQDWYRRMLGAVLAGVLLWMAAIWGTVVFQAGEIRDKAYASLALESETLARVYAEALRRVIGEMDTALLLLREEYLDSRGGDLAGFARISQVLREGPLAGDVLQVAVIGADGFLAFSDLKRPAVPVDLRDREHFRAHLGTSGDDLFISKPVLGRVSGKWSIQLTRRMVGHDGRFAGVLVMSVDPAVFSDNTSTLMPLAQGVLTLLRRDLIVLSRHPDGPAYLGNVLPESARVHIEPGARARLRASLLDSRTRMIAYAPLVGHPLHAGVSLETGATEAIIAGEIRKWMLGAAAVTLLLLVAAVAAVRSLRSRAAWQAELAAQREHLADAQAAARMGSWEWRCGGDGFDWSDGMATLLRQADAAPSRVRLLDSVHPDDRARFEAVLAQCRLDATRHEIEHRIRRADGSEATVLSTVHRDSDGGRTDAAVLGVMLDITDRKEAELAARIADELVQQTSQPIVVTDPAGMIVRCNPAFCRTLGYSEEELVGRPAGSCTRSGRHDAEFYRSMWQALQRDGRWEGDIWNRRRSGEIFPEWLSITAIRDAAGHIEQFVGIYTDITERKRHEEAMWRAANYDSLTELPNRLLFADRLRAGIARARRSGSRLAMLYIDLDRFKAINDTYGHHAGDIVLRSVARGLAAAVREDDTVARISGDEFNALLQNLPDAAAVDRVARAMLRAAHAPIDIGGQSVTVSCSIGIAIFPDDSETADGLVALADAAMYRIKEAGRDGYARHAGPVVTPAGKHQEAA